MINPSEVRFHNVSLYQDMYRKVISVISKIFFLKYDNSTLRINNRDKKFMRERMRLNNSILSYDVISGIRAAIRLLVMVIIFGFMMIWVFMPTSIYRKNWRGHIQAITNSTYFGKQGTNLLMYTFPVLFVAVLGCIYLHFGKKLNENYGKDKRWRRLAFLQRPMLVKGPLGIVSGAELGFLFMFVALLLWSLSIYLYNDFSRITPVSAAKVHQKVWEAKLNKASLKLGVVGTICLSFLFFPVSRGSSVLRIFGLTSEGTIKYHMWSGHMAMMLFTAHGICYIIFWISTHQISEMLQWAKTGISNMAGELALFFGLGMWIATYPSIRRKTFELFFYTHYLYILFILFFILHVGFSYTCIMLPGFYLFLIDRYLRFLQSRPRVRLESARILPCDTVELNFSKSPDLEYTPTSIIFLNVPSISKLQWHPFTVISSSKLEHRSLSVAIKSEGSWSEKLNRILSSSPSERLEVSIEGPYGPYTTHFVKHETLVMVSGGSGITPFLSIIRELIVSSVAPKHKSPKILLVCVFKNSSWLTMLDLILPHSGPTLEFSDLDLQIEAYVTRENEYPSKRNKEAVQTLHFKPDVSDVAVSATLGPNGWLWLGAVISSSFIVFLVTTGLLTQYYIYPIDKNTNKIYPASLKSIIYILFACISVLVTASTAFLLTVKRNSVKDTKILNKEVFPFLAYSTYSRDIELESIGHLPHIRKAEIHYGQRPDLKRILRECKGSSVGVLVCGPSSLRNEVATICSSGLASHFHFESISFSW